MYPRHRRAQNANILAETLLAILVASLIATVLVNMFTQVKRAGTAMHSELLVAAVSQEIVDQLRAMPFDFIFANIGTHTVQVNGTGSDDDLFPRPLLKDESTLDYSAGGDPLVSKGMNNELHTLNVQTRDMDDTAEVRIIPAGNGALRVEITIFYVDGTGKVRQHFLKTVLTQNGVTG
jgi:hypothetical protein